MSVNFDELIALYAVSDVCLVTSTRDGMNLVSYEYIACQEERHGVMILSEFAGAAQSLSNGALVTNPWNTEELAEAIHTAVTMSDEERLENHKKLHKYVKKYTSAWWGQSFVNELTRLAKHHEKKSVLRRQSHVHDSEGKPTVQEGNTQMEINGTRQETSSPKPRLGSRSHTAF